MRPSFSLAMPRVVLTHPPTETDDSNMAQLFACASFLRNLPFLCGSPSPQEMASIRERELLDDNIVAFRVHEVHSGHFVGTAKIRRICDYNDTWEVGLGVAGDKQGRGYCSEILFPLIEMGFKPVAEGGLGANRISFTTGVDNLGMCRWLEASLGARREGVLKEAWKSAHSDSKHDVAIYAILRREWEGDAKQRLSAKVSSYRVLE
ncbi:hypothetical protein HDU80_001531 [Chytriomyces hyalinus]|nr:hypothetical protein HDU80_001531 [Chytriomyces hyalinus]